MEATSPRTNEARPITLEALDEVTGKTSLPVDYYDAISKHYLVKNAAGRWLAHGLSSYKRILRSRGYRSRPPEGSSLSEIDDQIPDACADRHRYNVATYHHPELKESLEKLSPESNLLESIDSCYSEDFGRRGIMVDRS